MQRFFIADIHLNDHEPVITTGFLQFIDSLPAYSELYILGDLFDYWIGDDELTPLHQQIASALCHLRQRNVTVYFVHGNRDFLLAQRFAQACQMQLLPDINLINNQHSKLLILHGDLLCTDDQDYQKFRKKIHNRWLQKLFLSLPLFLRRKIATKLRGESQQHNNRKSERIMDVNQQAVVEMIQQYQADMMIHGHTHKPAIHIFNVNAKEVKRMVLGAWHDGINYIYQSAEETLEFYQLPIDIDPPA